MNTLKSSLMQIVRISSSDVNRRGSRRRPCLVDATINCSGRTEKGVVRDVSEGGCFAETALQCRIGDQVDLVLDRVGKRLQGTVVQVTAVGPRIAFAGDGMQSALADCISLETISDMVRLTKLNHIAFVKTVVDAVEAGAMVPSGDLATAHHCRLGRWCNGASDPATRELISFKALHEPHHAVHDCGAQALVALAADDRVRVQREVAAMRDASDRVLRILDEFGKDYPTTTDAESRVTRAE